jgi:hypothetical protein
MKVVSERRKDGESGEEAFIHVDPGTIFPRRVRHLGNF